MTMAIAPQAPGENRRQVISFTLDTETFGFGLEYVEKVLEAGKFSFVPRVPAFLRGALNHHGKVVAVIDLGEFFGIRRVELGVDSRVLILASETFHLGLLVGRVDRIESVPIRGPLVQVPEPGSTNPFIGKIINLGGRILNLVDVDKLLLEIENYFK